MADLTLLFQQFLRERRYLHNVTPKTVAWYEAAWLAFTRSVPVTEAPAFTALTVQQFIITLRDRGVSPVTCNTWLKALNVFGGWLHAHGHSPTRVHLKPLRVERRLVATLDEARIRALLSYKPRTFDEHRVHMLVCALLDTGCRIDEMLSAQVADFDFDNLLLTVVGKGRKERRIPFSTELRKRLYRFQQASRAAGLRSSLMFPERQGGKWHQRLIAALNQGENRNRFNIFFRNCADFVRDLINTHYYPNALRNNVIGDLGFTTPKQVAKAFVRYGERHPEIALRGFLLPQVPGNRPHSDRARGILESLLRMKRYAIPLTAVEPWIPLGLAAGYWGTGRFNPQRRAMDTLSPLGMESVARSATRDHAVP